MLNYQSQMSEQQSHQLFIQMLISALSPSANSTRTNIASYAMINPDTTTHQVLASNSSSYSSSNSHTTTKNTDRTKLFVGNLSGDTTLTDLFELFGQFGNLNYQLSALKDDNYAFIHYFNERSAEEAIRCLNGTYFKNRYIHVEYSNSDGHLRKNIKQKGDKNMFLYQYKNSKSSYDFNNNNSANLNMIGDQEPFNQPQITANTSGLRAIRGGNSRMPTMQSVANFRAYN